MPTTYPSVFENHQNKFIHDEDGQDIQCHDDLETGEMIMTFSEKYTKENNIQVGDTMNFIHNDDQSITITIEKKSNDSIASIK